MIRRLLSKSELELVLNRGSKSVKEVLGLHKEVMLGLDRGKIEIQTELKI